MNRIVLFLLTGVLLLASLIIGLRIGSLDADYAVVLEALLHYNPQNDLHFAVVELRLPRLLLACLVGASLAFCGYLMQVMVNNALADPFLLGTAAGASLGASASFAFFPGLTLLGFYLPPLTALAGAFLVTLVVVALGYRQGQLIPSQLLLAGVAISSLITALIGLIAYLSDTDSKLRAVVFWSMGGFERAGWGTLPYPALALGAALLVFFFLQKQLNILMLGETHARALGVKVAQTRWIMLLTIAAVTGFAVALSGPIGFVGLMVPHVTRSLLGVTGKTNLLFCALLGAAFMVLCDILARLLFPPVGIPIGIITALFGVPFFVYLLLKRNYRFN